MQEAFVRLSNIFLQGTTKNYKKGQTILDAGNTSRKVIFVKEGAVKQYSLTTQGDEIVHHFYKTGSVFPLALILSGKTEKHFFESLSDSVVSILPTAIFVNYLKQDSVLLFYFLQNFSAGLIGLTTRVETILNKHSQYRIISLLLYFGQRNKTNVNMMEIAHSLTHREIANWLGSSRETVSRQLENLRKNGLIDYQKRKIVITDTKRLEKKLNSAQ
jgi:CRP/FNR family transcriptional regulator